MNTNNKFCVGLSRLLASFIILASLLVLPKVQAAIGSTFTVGQLKYTVYTEDKASQTGTVSVEPISKEISGDIAIPASLIYGEINYSVTLIPDSAFRECSKLTSITIPDSVTSIGWDAFSQSAEEPTS
jgi:hypothetical protein